MPLVSIVIPCYNQAQYLPEAIDSALGQTHRPIEVVVVDDGSTDNIAGVIASYPNVFWVRQDNRGRSYARNAGFAASHGEYVVFLDADDRLTPNAIAAHLACFSAHPEAGLVVGDIDHMASDGSYIYSPRWQTLETNFYEELLKVNHLANTIGIMFRRSLFDALGGFAVELHAAEDYELLLRAARRSQSAHHSTVVAQYRRHLENTTRKGALMLQATHRVMAWQYPFVRHDRTLRRALRTGEIYWREHYGAITIQEICRHISRGHLQAAAQSAAVLIWRVRGRLLLLPWKKRHRLVAAIRRHVATGDKGFADHPAAGSSH